MPDYIVTNLFILNSRHTPACYVKHDMPKSSCTQHDFLLTTQTVFRLVVTIGLPADLNFWKIIHLSLITWYYCSDKMLSSSHYRCCYNAVKGKCLWLLCEWLPVWLSPIAFSVVAAVIAFLIGPVFIYFKFHKLLGLCLEIGFRQGFLKVFSGPDSGPENERKLSSGPYKYIPSI